MIPIFISKAEKAAKQLSVNPLMIWDDLLNIISSTRTLVGTRIYLQVFKSIT